MQRHALLARLNRVHLLPLYRDTNRLPDRIPKEVLLVLDVYGFHVVEDSGGVFEETYRVVVLLKRIEREWNGCFHGVLSRPEHDSWR